MSRLISLACTTVLLLLTACATPPEQPDRAPIASQEETPEPAPSESPKSDSPGVPDRAESSPVDTTGDAVAAQQTKATERWTPPVSRAPDTPGDMQRASLRTYFYRSAPVAAVMVEDDSARAYIEMVLARAGYLTALDGRQTLRVDLSFRRLGSEQNSYAEAVLRFRLDSAPGGLAPVASTELRGRSVFSPVSVYDAGMNSLLGIDSEEIEVTIDELRADLVAEAVRRGIEYRVTAPDIEDLRAVLDAVSVASDRSGYRYSFSVPEDLIRVLRRILDGSPYDAVIEAEQRHVTIVPMETGEP